MAAPKQARKSGTSSRAAGSGTKARDKGTRGGRPEAQAAATAQRQDGAQRQGGAQQGGGQARGGNGQGRAGGTTVRQRGAEQQRQQRKPPGGQPAGRSDALARAGADEGGRAVPLWLRVATLVLAVIGLADSTYLTIAHFTSSTVLACSDKGVVNCGLVTTSPQSELFGIFPVAVLGLAFYVFLVGIMSPWAWRAKWPVIGWARVGSLIVGIVFVLYLVYTELFTLQGHICLYCTYVHVITFLLFGLTMFAAAAGYGMNRSQARR